jgi:phage-related holin
MKLKTLLKHLKDYSKYFIKFGITIKAMFTKPLPLLACMPVMYMPVFTTEQKALILLGCLFIIDFATGIMASWSEFQKVLPENRKDYLIESDKLRLSAVKFITYAFTALMAWGIEKVFIIGEFEPHSKLQKMTFTTIVVAFCCAIEIYSIVFENFKRMGFDIIKKVKKIASSGWGVYKSIKNEKE